MIVNARSMAGSDVPVGAPRGAWPTLCRSLWRARANTPSLFARADSESSSLAQSPGLVSSTASESSPAEFMHEVYDRGSSGCSQEMPLGAWPCAGWKTPEGWAC